MPAATDATTLRQELYELRLHATRLQQEILATTDPAALDELLKEAGQVERDISKTETGLREAGKAGAPAETQHTVTRSSKTTALDATVSLRMTHIRQPSITCSTRTPARCSKWNWSTPHARCAGYA